MRNLKRQIDLPKLHAVYEAFPYQQQAYEEIRDLPFAAIFHEQGLGKTKIAIDLMLYWLKEREIDTVIIVTKKQLITNWKNELLYHANINPSVLTNSRSDNYTVLTSDTRVIVTNFETIPIELSRLKLFLDARAVAIIIDESAKIKNPDTKVTQALFALSSQFKIKVIMTGTPIANRPYDIWSQVYFLDSGVSLGADFGSFKIETDLSNDLSKNQKKQDNFSTAVSSVFARISHFTVRETKNGSGIIELPSKMIHDIYSSFETVQATMYEQVKTQLSIVIQKGNKSIFDDSSASLKRMMRLLEITSNPRIIDDSYENESGKESALKELLQEIMRSNEQCIVWSSFTRNIDYLDHAYHSYGTAKVYGKMNMRARDSSLESFKKGESRILFATPQAAKEGLTLTNANHAIFYDRSFNLDDYLQAQDRIHRVSQTKNCHVYNLIMKDSIDIWIDKLLHAKRDAAALGQGDISKAAYNEIADYSYSDLVKDVLGITGD